MKNHTTFVINPAAGRGRVGRMLRQLEAAIVRHAQSSDAEIVVTQAPGHATQIAQRAAPGSRVVAVGGDGTVHEVLRGIAGSDKAIGVVPIGSGNDFARMVGLHKLPLEAALRTALYGAVRSVDLGVVNHRPFGASLGIGFDAAVARKALSAPTFLRGMPRYLYSIFAVLRELELPNLELIQGNQVLYQGPSLLVALMNGSTYGGGIPIVPDALPTDGLISAAVAGSFSRLGVVGILPQLLMGKHVHHPRLHFFHGTEFVVRFDRPVPAHSDGELLEPSHEYRVQMIPGGLRVVQSGA
ncbi:diacylglycerol/lipid kinase family protein [Meiothermus ruber]|jgi:YegS/Rv2252/BmrU family lipid kinase|uniref:Diacylglycerol kinase catalytic region n=1 Tax=Meiothermus ruber (strain ATCC 35948 / DSM 1279 / VKM B-1258 / 21) TaxID=504728 RepID=D3PMZ0_MEIRD|nr:diacylglycerol kinase family protein [Meiothermus ruber]GIW38823.1 MAG: diacylglycerol kinase [Meiothermus sp.]ADD29317.1 diacylglycerol kinase catalytic region [Meiothermus ruber DSM 1279]AGK05233.1 diacylglycerol kinase catalytic subunit [Meiothermus ruber DSM 1279]MCL6529162.1 diacylglycerol kinase family lipid kinase [Meiothermus ruber]GAO76239.1 diacylglycerol kinase catalytic subunit [Meiothermus ruber H328]